MFFRRSPDSATLHPGYNFKAVYRWALAKPPFNRHPIHRRFSLPHRKHSGHPEERRLLKSCHFTTLKMLHLRFRITGRTIFKRPKSLAKCLLKRLPKRYYYLTSFSPATMFKLVSTKTVVLLVTSIALTPLPRKFARLKIGRNPAQKLPTSRDRSYS